MAQQYIEILKGLTERKLGLLHSRRVCPNCGREMVVITKKNWKSGYTTWRCRKSKCKKEICFPRDTWFDDVKMSLKDTFWIMYKWSW